MFYVLLMGLITTIFKVIAMQANKFLDGFILVMILGAIIRIYGIFFAQTREKLKKDIKKLRETQHPQN